MRRRAEPSSLSAMDLRVPESQDLADPNMEDVEAEAPVTYPLICELQSFDAADDAIAPFW